MESMGLSTLHNIPRYDLAYLRLSSLDTSCLNTKKYCLRLSLFFITLLPTLYIFLNKQEICTYEHEAYLSVYYAQEQYCLLSMHSHE